MASEIERQHHVSLKLKHIKVQVLSGLFYNEQTDVVVNSTSQGLRLTDGQGSKALLEAAGEGIQSEASAKYPDGVDSGDIAITGGYNLYCALVYHSNLRRWTDSDHDSAEEVLKQIVTNSLKESHKTNNIQSITFPALGRGFSNFPAKTLAKLMFQCVADFEENLGEEPTIKDVRFVIYPADEETIKAFIDEVKKRSQNVVTSMEYSTNIGNIELTLLQGSLVKHCCDVVVHETVDTMDLSKSPVSKELSEAAGPDLEKSLKANVSGKLSYDKIAVTGNANLTNCKAVYHGSLPNYTNQSSSNCKEAIKTFVVQCLMEASETGFASISFPPLGTEVKKYPPDVSAEAIQESIIEFICSNCDTSTLKQIHFVVPQTGAKIFQAFKDVMFPESTGTQRFDKTLVAKSSAQPVRQALPVIIPALNSIKISPIPPTRGSKQWLVNMYEKDVLTPPSWTYFPGGQRVRKLKIDPAFATRGVFKLVDVEQKTLQAIKSLVSHTWDEESFSHGRDAQGLGDLSYKKIRVLDVKRVENLNLFEKYGNFRQQMFGKVSSQSRLPLSPGELQSSKGQLLTTANIDPCLTKDIYPEINEHYVFHGTKEEYAEIIMATGLDSRMAGAYAMFGAGVYAAESSTKADQYADDKDKRDMKKPKNMFLTRMCMGDICLVKSPIQFKRPPCKSCRKSVCSTRCRNTQLYDSVLVDGQWIFREMIVYDHAQCYPEFLITYKRVK